MDVLKNNSSIPPELKELYTKNKDKIYPLEETKNGLKTYRIQEIFIHSRYDPLKEAERAVTTLLNDSGEVDVYILLGNGLGYCAKSLYRQILKESKEAIKPYILWIEKDPLSFLAALEVNDMGELFADPNFKFFLDTSKENIGSFLQTIPTKRIRYYYHRPLYVLFENYYREIQNYIGYILDRKDMNTATLVRFQKIWARNLIYNTPYYPFTGKIQDLKNTAEGSTVVLIAGGPTLEKILPLLQKERSNLILVAVDTAYKYLKSHGIVPEIVVSVDPQYWNYKYLEKESLTDSILITDSSSYFQMFRDIEPARIFTGNSLFELAKYFIDNNCRGTMAAGGSVSTTAFDIARMIGAKKIILAGLDLGFPNHKTHFKGAFFENNFIFSSDYFHSAEQKSVSYLVHTGELLTAKATDGSLLITDPKMILFKRWIEREISLTDAQIILPELGGSFLEGAKLLPLNEIKIEENNARNDFLQHCQKLIEQNRNFKLPYHLKEKMFAFLNTAKEIEKESSKIASLIPQEGNISEKNIQEIDWRQKNLFSTAEKNLITSIVSSSAQDILLSISENVSFSEDSQKSVWIKTKKLYEAIQEMSNFYAKNFQKLLKIIHLLPNINSDGL